MDSKLAAFTWADIIKLAFTTGLIAALFSQAIAWLRELHKDYNSTTREARYLALRLAVILERFSIDCASLIADNQMYRDCDGYAGTQRQKLPALTEFPKDADWKALAPNLSSKVLSTENELMVSDEAIAVWEDIDRNSVGHAADQQAGKSGYRAWLLAVDLRCHYKLPPFDISIIRWNFVAKIKQHHDQEIELMREHQNAKSD